MAWTLERERELRKLWAEGLSASQIGKRLGGLTRNAVIGKVHRLGLAGRSNPARPRFPKKPSGKKPSSNSGRKPRAKAVPALSSSAKAALATPKSLGNGEFPTILTIKDSMCKWPIGDPQKQDFRFCGHSAPHGAYCAGHAQIAFQPRQKHKGKTPDAGAALDAIAASRRINF